MEMPGQLGLSEMINAMAASQPIYAVPTAGPYPIEALAQYPHHQYVQQGHFLTPVSASAAMLTRAHPGLQQHPGLRAHHHAMAGYLSAGPPGMGPVGPRPESNGGAPGFHPHHPHPHGLVQERGPHPGGPPHPGPEERSPVRSASPEREVGRGHSRGVSEGRVPSEERERDRRADRPPRDHRRERDYKERRDRGDRRDYRDRDRGGRERDLDRFERRSRERSEFDRDRERERDRGVDRDRVVDRDRGVDRDRERDRDRDRRDRYRDDDRGSSPRSARGDRHGDHYDRIERDYLDDDRVGDYKSMPPNNTIMVRGLAQHITENDIRDNILSCNLTPKDIRLVRRKESGQQTGWKNRGQDSSANSPGASRGFAFVEFSTVTDATRWMEAKQGVLLLNDSYRATLQYSIPKDVGDRQIKASQDWICVRCGVHNFKRRDSCFKCSAPRHESEAAEDGGDEACNYPTYKLVLRGLDVLSTEEGVLQAIQHASTDLPIKSVRIGRDPLTNLSRGVCFVELDSVYDAMTLFNKLMSRPPTIDNKAINISYCKLGNNQTNSSMAKPNASEYWGNSAPTPPNPPAHSQMPQTNDIAQLAEYSASLYATNPEEHTAYLQYYTQYYEQQQSGEQSATTQSDSVNAAAAVAQSALQAMQNKSAAAVAAASGAAAAATASTATATTTAAPAATTAAATAAPDYPQYPTPDVSTYQYDETSGYYYDPLTSLYYDSNTCYYYNSESGQFLYWDAERSTYLPAPNTDDDLGNKHGTGEKKEKDKDKQEKVKVAKKIAKDMERWAKAQNKRNESGKSVGEMGAAGGVGEGGVGSGAADAAFAVLLERRPATAAATPALPEKSLTLKMQLKKEPATPSHGGLKKSGLVAAYGDEGSDSAEEESAAGAGPSTASAAGSPPGDDDLLDLSKMACLLCKRQFANREGLNRHVQLSSLHKNNLEALRGGAGEEEGVDDDGLGGQYRDRALERRKKYGMPNRPPPNKLKEKYMSVRKEISSVTYEEPTKRGIGADNIGNKLLKKMGWNDGQGLGKSNQGRTEIIEAERRVSSVGLGVAGANYTVVGDSYKDCVKKMMYHRYQELDAQEKEDSQV